MLFSQNYQKGNKTELPACSRYAPALRAGPGGRDILANIWVDLFEEIE